MEAKHESTESVGGSVSLLDRLEQAKKSFSEPIDVPIEDSEDVLILWLTKLITTKALELSPQESEAAWKTLEVILSSSHLEALVQKGWVCLLDSCFMETLASHVANADSSVQTYAVRITYILLQNPRLSPMVTHRPVHCLILLEGVIKWIMNDHRQDKNVSLALMLTKEIGSFMKSDNDRKASISSVMDHVFLPYVRLCSTSNTEDCENMKKLLFELKQLLSFGLFNETSKEMYMDILSVLFSEETKVTLPADGSQIFSSLIMFINSEPVELCKHLLYEFLTSFAVAYKNCKDMNHRMTIVLCFIIGVSVKGSNILAINKNNLACQQITAQQCSYQKQEALLLSVLVAVKDLHFNHDVTLKSIGPKRWMNNLADLLIKHMLRTASGVQCLQTLLQISPKDVVDLILNNFSPIVKCVSNAVNPDDYDTSKDLASATDDLLCEVLQVYSQLQEAPSMLVNILHSLLKMPKGIGKRTIIPESLYIYDGTLLLPPRFMSQLMKVFSNLVHTNVIATWNVFLTLMTEKFTTLLEESAQYRNFKLVTVAVWLLSCLLRAFPIMEIVSVAGVCENVAQLMIQTARDGIQRLVSIMLTLPHNNDLCGSLLILCHTWGELHIGLCQLDKYVEYPDVSPVQMPEPSQQSADFSYVLPFISSDIWAQISARVVNFGNQPTQLAMVQLVLQKLCFSVHYHQSNFGVRVRCEEESLLPTRQIFEACTRYLLNAVEQWGENIMQLLTFHLPYLITFVHESHLPTIARYLVTGFKEEKEYWKEYINSVHFLEAYRLHPHILSCICSCIVSSWNSRKRKFSETDLEVLHKENHALQLITKLSDTKGALCDLSATSSEIKETTADVHKDCGAVFSKLIEKKKSEESLGCVKDMVLLKKLLRRLPFTYLSQHNKNVVMFLLLSTVVNDEYNCTQEKLEILVTTTSLLRNQKSINVLNMIDIDQLLKWLFLKRLTMPLCVHSSKTIPLFQEPAEHVSDFWLKDERTPNTPQSLDTLISHEVDLLIRYIVDSSESRRTKNLMQNLSDYITTSEELPCDKETRLHVAVLLLWVCQKKIKPKFTILPRSRKYKKLKKAETKVAEEGEESREAAYEHLSSWILKFLKKADMATIQPPTAASLLIAHTIILSEEAKNFGDIQNHTSQQDSEKEGQTEIHNTAEVKHSKKKTPKCMKLLDHSLKLCELCVLGNNGYLVEHALNFYQKLGEHHSSLCSYLPQDFFRANWVILCNENLWSKNSDLKQVLQSCLNSFILIATDDEFENVLKKLIGDIQTLANISHTLTIWQIVISSQLDRKKVVVRRIAERHLTLWLINLVTLKSSDVSSHTLLSVVETLQVIVKSNSMMTKQSRGLFMKLSTSLPLLPLPLEYFYKIFRILIDIVTSVVVSSSDCIKECIPSILIFVGQFSEALISHSNRKNKLNEQEIKMLVQSSALLEVFVGSLTSLRPFFKNVMHVALGRIIVCLQSTSVYPDVKVILENIIYHLLDICSRHSFNHLSVTLPSTSATLLKHLYKNYENFYRYHSHVRKGKL